MILILPCAGESSRFPGTRPKWMLTHPSGNLMVCESISKIDTRNVEKIVLIVLDRHLQGDLSPLSVFQRAKINVPLETYVIKDSRSQPETVASYLKNLNQNIKFFIKDCDNQFECLVEEKNEIAVTSVDNVRGKSMASKSYCRFNSNGIISSIVEKRVISNTFCVGGYSFTSSRKFLESYDRIKHHDNLYVSHIIQDMILNGTSFTKKEVRSYYDWGTLEDWLEYRDQFSTIFLDIDGVLVKNSSEFFEPKWGETAALEENVKFINSLFNDGKTQIILTTSRTENYKIATQKQLEDLGIKYHSIIFGLLHAKRIVINDYDITNPNPSCISISLPRNEDSLRNHFI